MYLIKYHKVDRVKDTIIDPITTAASAFKILKDLALESRECFWALFLDARRSLLSEPYLVSMGTTNQTLVHPREVFREAIKLNAVAMIVAHNHPSVDPTPSQDDFCMTDRLVQAGSLLGIEILDHIIIAPDGGVNSNGDRDGSSSYKSMRAMGRIGNPDLYLVRSWSEE